MPSLPLDTRLERLTGAIKARRVCEQAHERLEKELGLDHFKGADL